MSKQQKVFNRKLVKYDRSFFTNVPKKLLRANDPVLTLEVTIDKLTKNVKVKRLKRL